MSRRLMVAVATIAVLGASTTAIAAKKPASDIRIVGGVVFKAGKSVTDNQRFQSRTVQVKSGRTVDFVNKARTEDPHTISIVSKLPKGFNCEECGAIEESHGVPENGDGPPANPVVDGGDGFNAPGDSIVVNGPGQPGDSGEIEVTAPGGTTLKFMCIIHPWMQGKLKVTK